MPTVPVALGYRHQRVQRLRRLAGRRATRDAERAFVAEGAKVIAEALAAGAAIEAVYVDPAASPAEVELAERCLAAGARVWPLEAGVLERVGGTVSPQPLMAVVGAVDVTLEELLGRRPGLLVVCSDLRDPGNAGTVVRSAEAAGAGGVVFCDGCVDAFNPKTVRASAGAVLHVPVVNGVATDEAMDAVGRAGLRRLGAVAHGGVDYVQADLASPVALVVGNEAHGLSGPAAERLDGLVTIPMTGRAESLNVGMATAVLCFEAARQRRAVAAPC